MSETTNLSSNLISEENQSLLKILKAFCYNNFGNSFLEEDWNRAYVRASGHNVASFVNEIALEFDNVPKDVENALLKEARQTVLANYRFAAIVKDIIDTLEAEGVETVILKGLATASFYRIPELRKSGDIDILLLDANDLSKTEKILNHKGFITDSQQNGSHHLVMRYENITIEIHTSMSEEFDNKSINEFQDGLMKEIRNNVCIIDCMGYKIPALSDAYHGYELLIHMLQHFLREGFGLRLLCDWCMFWNREINEAQKETYLQLIKDSKTKTFSDIITLITIKYLGLPEEKVAWMGIDDSLNPDIYLADILDSGEFGILENDRMIALNDNNILEYVKVFHHQMHHNFPRSGKIFIIWPVLWVATLIIFVRNNKKVRNNNGMAYLKKARSRSLLVKNLNLFN